MGTNHQTLSGASMEVHVYLPSGKGCSVSLPSESRVRDVKLRAQQQLKRSCLRLAFAGRRLDDASTLSEVGVRDGDHIDAVVQLVSLASTEKAFVLHSGGAVVTWGDPAAGGDSSQVQAQLARVQQVQGNGSAFAAVLEDGSVVTWGDPRFGGDSSQVQEQLVRVRLIQGTSRAFAAILADGCVVTWGASHSGGDSIEVRGQLVCVQHVQATREAFAAILEDGSVVTWGNPVFGGDSGKVQEQLVGVHQVQAAWSAFAAILEDGSVVTWGDPHFGGDSSQVREQLTQVRQIQANWSAFCCHPSGWLCGDLGQCERGRRQQPGARAAGEGPADPIN